MCSSKYVLIHKNVLFKICITVSLSGIYDWRTKKSLQTSNGPLNHEAVLLCVHQSLGLSHSVTGWFKIFG